MLAFISVTNYNSHAGVNCNLNARIQHCNFGTSREVIFHAISSHQLFLREPLWCIQHLEIQI